MPRGLRIISIILFIIGLGFLLLMMIAQRFLTRSLPKTQGELLLSGLKYEVRVYRDGYHIPHIIAQNEHDLFFTQGFITAQDRLWQMDLWRRAAQGRLSEILGRSTIVHDSLMLTLGISRTVREMEAQLSVKSRQVLQAYSDGINACIKEQNDKWPIEFLLLNYRPEPWTIYDCLTILRWAAWHMSSNTSHNLIGSAINAKVGYEKASVFNLGNKQLTIKGQPEKSRIIIPALIKAETFIHANNSVFPSGKNQCWAISGERSVTGKPIIIVETLFPFSCPSLWYETHLHHIFRPSTRWLCAHLAIFRKLVDSKPPVGEHPISSRQQG